MSLYSLPFQDLYLQSSGDEVWYRSPNQDGSIEVPPLETMGEIQELRDALNQHSNIHKRQDFRLNFKGMVLRCSRVDSVGGIYYSIRRLPSRVPLFSELGYPAALEQKLTECGKENGLILLSGPTGTGKSTLAATTLRTYLHSYGNVAVTVEDPPELPLQGMIGKGRCLQIEVHNRDFATPLHDALRHSPKYLLIGETRSPEVAAEVLRMSVSGHLIITTTHAGSIPDSFMAIARLASAAIDSSMVWSILSESFLAAINLSWPRHNRRPTPNFLFVPESEAEAGGLRTMIKEGKPERLSEYIRTQRIHLLSGGEKNSNGGSNK